MLLDKIKYESNQMGYYLPSFFSIHLKTKSSLKNLNDLPSEDLSTLVHEYVHFMQDITTTFGLTNIINNVNIQKAINAKIIAEKTDSFQIPVSIEEFSDTEEYANLNFMFMGDFESKFNDYSEITSIELVENGIIPNHEEKGFIQVNFRNFHEEYSFCFGAIHLMENMAYLIEKSMFDRVNPPVYPYKIVNKLIEFIYPDFKPNAALVVLICDYSLMAGDPGRFFYSLMGVLKEEQATTFEHIYDIIRKYTFHNDKTSEMTLFGLYEERLNEALTSLKDYFTIDYFKEINEWFEVIFEDIGTFRMEQFNFWYELLGMNSKEERYAQFAKMTSIGGFPLISNENGEVILSHPKLNPQNLLALRAIFSVNNILYNRRSDCNMQDICKNSPKDITSHRCNQPWLQGVEPELCPFGQIIRMWGIYDKSPTLRISTI